ACVSGLRDAVQAQPGRAFGRSLIPVRFRPGWVSLKKMCGDAPGLVANRARRENRSPAAKNGAAARVAAGTVWREGRVAATHADILKRNFKFVRNHLRKRRLQALSVRGDTEDGVDGARRVDAYCRGLGPRRNRRAGGGGRRRSDSGEFDVGREANAHESSVRA